MKLFVYGTLKKNKMRGHVLEGQAFIGCVETSSDYKLFDVGGYPAMKECSSGDGSCIKGELYETTEFFVTDVLDEIEGHPHLFERKEILLKTNEYVTSYIYTKSVSGFKECSPFWE